MKKLNEKASKILCALLALDEPLTDNNDGKEKQVTAKTVDEIGRYKFFTLSYFSDVEGFQMREPEITIVQDTATDEYFPTAILYDLDGINSTSISFPYGELVLMNEKIQADHADITNKFLESLGENHKLL